MQNSASRENVVTLFKRYIPILIIIIVCLCTSLFANNELPEFGDELGYIANGAASIGMSWKDAFVFVPSYAYGYGFLIGIFLFLFGEIGKAYVALKIANIIMLILSYFILLRIIENYVQVKSVYINIAALLCVLMPTPLVMQNYALPEIGIMLLYYISILLLQKHITSKNNKYKYWLIAIAFILVMLHARLIGVFASIILVLLWYRFVTKKVTIKDCVIVVLLLLLGASVYVYLKNTISEMTGLGMHVTDNSAAANVNKIQSLFDFKMLINLIRSIVAKSWALLCGSGVLLGAGIVYTLNGCRIKNKEKSVMSLYLLLSFVSELAISAIGMMSIYDRVDTIFYTRYAMFSAIPLIGIGFSCACLDKKKKKILIIGISMVVLLSLALSFAISQIEIPTRIIPYSVSDIMLWWNGADNNFLINVGSKVSILAMLYWCLAKRKESNIVIALLLLVMFITCTKKTFDDKSYLAPWANYNYEDESRIIQCDYNEVIYLVEDTWNDLYIPAWLQVLNPHSHIEVAVLEKGELTKLDYEDVYMVQTSMINEIEKYDYEILQRTEKYSFISILNKKK